MSEIINIAFFTDFSEVSRASLESIMFNTWNFRCNIHLIHFIKDDEEKNTFNNILKETQLNASEGQTVSGKPFEKDEPEKLVEFLNSSNFQIIGTGMSASISKENGKFLSLLIQKVNKDLTFIPESHQIKIENRATIVLDIKNLENLYLTSLFEEFYNFLYTKITIFLLSDEVLTKPMFEEVEQKIKTIMPNLNFQVINHDKSNCLENFKSEIERDGIDYLIIFKNDYFENFMLKLITNNTEQLKWNFSIYRSYVNTEIIDNLKKGINPFPKITLI